MVCHKIFNFHYQFDSHVLIKLFYQNYNIINVKILLKQNKKNSQKFYVKAWLIVHVRTLRALIKKIKQ